jgi:hypothetical protein
LKRTEILGELVLWMSCEGEVFDKSSEREQRERENRGERFGPWSLGIDSVSAGVGSSVDWPNGAVGRTGAVRKWWFSFLERFG